MSSEIKVVEFSCIGSTTYGSGAGTSFLQVDLPLVGGGQIRQLFADLGKGVFITRTGDHYVQLRFENERTLGKFHGDRIVLSQLAELSEIERHTLMRGEPLVWELPKGDLIEQFEIVSFAEQDGTTLRARSTLVKGENIALIREYTISTNDMNLASLEKLDAHTELTIQLRVKHGNGQAVETCTFVEDTDSENLPMEFNDILQGSVLVLDYRFDSERPLSYHHTFDRELPTVEELSRMSEENEKNKVVRTRTGPGIALLGVALVAGGIALKRRLKS